jgi:hypothetical protein
VIRTIKATAIANTLYRSSGSLKITRIKIGNAILANIELRETNLVRYKTNKKTPTQQTATSG